MFGKKHKMAIIAVCASLVVTTVILGSIGFSCHQLCQLDGHPMLTAKSFFFFNLK